MRGAESWWSAGALAALLLSAGCKSSDPGNCVGPSTNPGVGCVALGDPHMPMQIVIGEARLQLIAASDPSKDQLINAQFVALDSSSDIDLYLPPQGGHVAYLGARVTNSISCNLTLRSSLFDIYSGDRVQFEERNTSLVPVAGMPGWGQPDPFDPSSYNNVPLCPDYLVKDIVDQPYALEVIVSDCTGRQVKARVDRVVPRCREDDPRRRALCDCECRAHYYLGRCAPLDGGAPADGAAWDAQ